ncbi:MAG: alpha/beta hydrolase [Candidatus Limnocylindrales bacterium]
MPHLDANGLSVAYEVDGAGPPMVLLHGATGSGADHFASLAPIMARGFRTYRPDARGHAGTHWDAADGWTAADLVDDLAAFADRLGLSTFHLVGYSMGAMTALQFAARHPDRLRTLVVISISPEREPRLAVGRRLLDPERIQAHEPAWARQLSGQHDPVQGTGGWQRLLAVMVGDLAAQPLLTPHELRAIDPPTLVVVGDRDPFVPVDQAWRLVRQVRDGRLLVLPGVAHDAVDDLPAVLHPALAEFYQATATAAHARATVRGKTTQKEEQS